MASDSFAVLLHEQASVMGVISRFLTNFKKLGQSKWTHTLVTARLASLDHQMDAATTRDARLSVAATEEQLSTLPYFIEDRFRKCQDDYQEAYDFMREVLVSLEPSCTPPPSVQPSVVPSPGVRKSHLPKFKMPTFSGSVREWQSFRSLFTSLVINDSTLSDVDRLLFLMTAVTGKALEVIRNLELIDSNFQVAWDALIEQFDDKRHIVNEHIKALMNLPAVNYKDPESLSNLRNQWNSSLKALRNLGRSPETCCDLAIFLATARFDATTLREWKLEIYSRDSWPTYEDLNDFLRKHAKVGEQEAAAPLTKKPEAATPRNGKPIPAKRMLAHVATTSTNRCMVCSEDHTLYVCTKFREYSWAERDDVVRRGELCRNCLSKGHWAQNCKSKKRCLHCRGLHHTLLHKTMDKSRETSPLKSPEVSSLKLDPVAPVSDVTNVHTSCRASRSSCVLLPTARVKIFSDEGRSIVVRALLDQGSQGTLVTERIVQYLRLSRTPEVTRLSGIGDAHTVSRSYTHIGIAPVHADSPSRTARATVLRTLTKYSPRVACDLPALTSFTNLHLADDPFSSTPFDLVLGAEEYARFLCPGILQGAEHEPIAQNTVFGWILSGSITSRDGDGALAVHSVAFENLQEDLRRFWEVEQFPDASPLNEDDARCEAHFVATHRRSDDGRYIVRLPFRPGAVETLGSSRGAALGNLNRLIRRLSQDPARSVLYSSFINEYESLGHMSQIEPRDLDMTLPHYYLPHHAVFREGSTTTKLRVVFNASSRTTSGSSLNECLYAGPKLQLDLPAIILRWRQSRYVLTADVSKMYRQVLVHPEDRDFQRILWAPDEHSVVNEYRLNTVTYGMTSAPFLALRVVKQLALDEGIHYPYAARIVTEQMYVDDVIFGTDDIETALEHRNQLIALMHRGGFVLHKWSSNYTPLLTGLEKSDHTFVFEDELTPSSSQKVLGIVWRPLQDIFSFEVSVMPSCPRTKRTILSSIARLFDPLGWLTPVTIKAKILLQDLWRLKCDWDAEIPPAILIEWSRLYSQLPAVTSLSIPRWSQFSSTVSSTELHGFSDASLKAYAACIYLKTNLSSGKEVVTLLIAKSKVSPIQTVCIPRLELCASVMLVRLMRFVRASLPLLNPSCFCWTDSTIVLHWLRKSPSTWATFVANRVSRIQENSGDIEWRHVPTADNPADCASRGIWPTEMPSHPLWWSGPAWLHLPPTLWPQDEPTLAKSVNLELSKTVVHVHAVTTKDTWDLNTRYSSWFRLIRVTAYIRRFANRALSKARGQETHAVSRFLGPSEFQQARAFWLRKIQKESFSKELEALTTGTSVPRTSSLASLMPFLDSDGILRARGRLAQSGLMDAEKFPILLKSHPLVTLIISDTHLRLLHGGSRVTLACLRREFWLLRARQVVRGVLYQCVKCIRYDARPSLELMGDLPACRVNATSRAFLNVGLDYAGPFHIRMAAGRGRKSTKAYLCLFVCMVTKAVHTELVSDCTTAAFLNAFQRFVSRRGTPANVYSDNATTFQGACNEIEMAYRSALNDPAFRDHHVNAHTEWHFIPPRSPHFGGLWEAGIKSVKHHLARAVGDQRLTYEEMTTVLCRIEAILNSRPIGSTSENLDDRDYLTPGHFLIGTALVTPPEQTVLNLNENRLTRWQIVQRISESVWKWWRHDYLHTLQQRVKWRDRHDLARVGRLVIIKDPSLPPGKWTLGRITRCHVGDDGLTRVVDIKTATSECKRAVTNLCFLPDDINRILPPSDGSKSDDN